MGLVIATSTTTEQSTLVLACDPAIVAANPAPDGYYEAVVRHIERAQAARDAGLDPPDAEGIPEYALDLYAETHDPGCIVVPDDAARFTIRPLSARDLALAKARSLASVAPADRAAFGGLVEAEELCAMGLVHMDGLPDVAPVAGRYPTDALWRIRRPAPAEVIMEIARHIRGISNLPKAVRAPSRGSPGGPSRGMPYDTSPPTGAGEAAHAEGLESGSDILTSAG